MFLDGILLKNDYESKEFKKDRLNVKSYIVSYDVFYTPEKAKEKHHAGQDHSNHIREIIKKYLQGQNNSQQIGQTVFIIHKNSSCEEIHKEIIEEIIGAGFKRFYSKELPHRYETNITVAEIAQEDDKPMVKVDLSHSYNPSK
ncbi:MAG: hypothetical protein E6713_05935 [Sporomusaceae bacterium]|nr:hypothetical protein [Sporomusaceae bacterium]